MYNFIARRVLAPVFDFSMGTKVMKCLKEMEDSQWWSSEKILTLQNIRLEQLIQHAYKNVPYYRKIMEQQFLVPDDIKTGTSLSRLPILTKATIRGNFDSLVARNMPSKSLWERSTSGSTGEPLKFCSEKEKLNYAHASSQRALEWSGYKLGDKCVFIGQKREYGSRLVNIKQNLKSFFERMIFIDVQSISEGRLDKILRKIEDFHPEYFWGYPSAIYSLADHFDKQFKSKLELKAIITIAEATYDYQRELFRKVFSCEAFSLYSATETSCIASECSSHQGYHITSENVIVEIVDHQDMPVAAGKEGRIIVTNLHNYAMPFIRYDIGDIGTISEQPCSCGRNLTLLSRLDGRVSDNILTKDGRNIPGLALHQHFVAWLEGLIQWQIVQENTESIQVKLVLDKKYPVSHLNNLTSEIIKHYQSILGEAMTIDVDFVDSIPLTAAGKRRFIISKVIQS
jgi:phenylacetate-CoA ligase